MRRSEGTARRRIALLALALGAILCVPAAFGQPAERPTASATARSVELREYFTKEDFERSRRYRAARYALAFIGIGAEIVALLVIGLRPGTQRLGSLAARLAGDRWWLQAILLAAAVSILLALVELPFSAGRQNLDKAWGLSTRSPWGFLSDIGRQVAFQTVLVVIAAVLLVGVARAVPHGWPFVAAGGAIVLTIGLSMLWPVVYEPLFNRFTPVEPALRDRIVQLGRAEGVKVGSVVVADASRRTTTQNAYVSGLGATKRVVLYDTLLEKSSPREVDLVVAHELAHVAHSDVAKGTALGAVGAALAVAVIWALLSSGAVRTYLGVEGVPDPRALPFVGLVLVVASFVAMPAGNWYSRRIEAAADRTALRVTRDAKTSIDVEVALARDNIADLEPNPAIRWVFFTHPTVAERIHIALDEQQAGFGTRP